MNDSRSHGWITSKNEKDVNLKDFEEIPLKEKTCPALIKGHKHQLVHTCLAMDSSSLGQTSNNEIEDDKTKEEPDDTYENG